MQNMRVSLNVENMSNKRWSDNVGWEMAMSMHHMVMEKTNKVLGAM